MLSSAAPSTASVVTPGPARLAEAAPRVAVLGLGLIGAIWARHHAEDGRLAAVWNRSPRPGFPAWRESASSAAAAAELVHLVVSDPAAVRAVLAEILPVLGPGRVVVQSSTIDPASADEFRAAVEARGALYLEAPFTGSKPAAEARQTVFFLGGSDAARAAAEPALAPLSAARLPIGTAAQAAALKLALNLNLGVLMQGLVEARALAAAHGVGDAVFFGALARNAGHSGLVALKEPKLRAADFSPQFAVKHMHKDLRLASAAAGCAELPALDAAREQLKTALARGLGDEDFCAVAKVLGA